MARVGPVFGRVEPRRRAAAFVLGLLAELPRKNCWTIAEHAGEASPEGMQHFLGRAAWRADEVRDVVRELVVEHFGDPDGVLVLDETGDLKKGVRTVGVQRQYTGTAGRVENAQVAVYLAYATASGHALIDRRLYLPQSWTTDPDRCAAAGIPDHVTFATKPALGAEMVRAALDAGVPASAVTGDEVYGNDPRLRSELEFRAIPYVLAISCSHRLGTGPARMRADELASIIPERSWQSRSAGAGTKGHRDYDWAYLPVETHLEHGTRWLLLRRHRRTGELAFYRCYAPTEKPLTILVRIAGRRWPVEESFQAGKELAGLDEHQVRRWDSWHRWVTLSMLAHAFLAILTATERTHHQPDDDTIPLTCNEIRHLLTTLVIRDFRTTSQQLRFSTWRRRHQHRARTSHYQRRSDHNP